MNLQRREFLGTAAGAATAAAASLCFPGLARAAGRSSSAAQPNIIYILADDLGYGDIGCFGQTKVNTPYLDQMATEGTRFTSHYSGSTVCAPSRYSFLTGLHTGHTKCRDNNNMVLGEEPTVAHILKQAGYTNGAFGKWSNGQTGTNGAPRNVGFDWFFGYDDQSDAHHYYPEHLVRNEENVSLPGNRDGGREQYSHDLITDEILSFIRTNASGPFFAYIPYTIPHAELLVPDDSLNEYKGLWPETPFPGSSLYAAQDYPRAARAAMIARMDRDIGRIRALLGELGIEENTLVFFTSDNGPCTAGGQDPGFFNSSGPFRGEKRTLWEGGIRMPTVACWPGTLAAGAVNDRPSAAWDMMATFAELAGANAPVGHDGVSMAPELTGDGVVQQQHEALYWEFRDYTAVRLGKWKGIRTTAGGAIKLYDLSQDKGETNNLASEHSDVVSRIASIMNEQHSDQPVVLDMPSPVDVRNTHHRATSAGPASAAHYDLLGRRHRAAPASRRGPTRRIIRER